MKPTSARYDIRAALTDLQIPFEYERYFGNFIVACPFCHQLPTGRMGHISEATGNYLCGECGRTSIFLLYVASECRWQVPFAAKRIRQFKLKKNPTF